MGEQFFVIHMIGFNLSNVLISAIYEKKKVLYVPITFRPRQGGVNSINLKKICGIGIQAMKDFAVLNRVLEKAGRNYHE